MSFKLISYSGFQMGANMPHLAKGDIVTIMAAAILYESLLGIGIKSDSKIVDH